MTPNATDALTLLDAMLLIRACEQCLIDERQTGFCSSRGQEASAVGVVHALGPRDLVISNHRNAGHLLARGAEPERLFAAVFNGRAQHVTARSLGVMLTSPSAGAGLAMAPGVALAQKLGPPPHGLTAVFFGDGAACQGVFHEAANLAATWRLPVLFVCENNQWQGTVHRREAMPGEFVADWVNGHGLAADVVDGNDVQAVHVAASQAVAAIRDSGRPRLLELMTYRQRGHCEPDDQAYVCAAEHAHWLKRDPIAREARRLMLDADALAARTAEVRARIAQAFARSTPCPA